jgi:ribonuclease HI
MEFTKYYAEKDTIQQNENRQGWKKPDRDVLKVNIDGAFNADPLSGGWGFVVRDHDGVDVAAGAGPMQFPQNAIHAEAEACIQGLTAAMN